MFKWSLALAAVVAAGASSVPAEAQETKVAALRQASADAPNDAAASLAYARGLRRAARFDESGRELKRSITASGASGDVLLGLKLEAARAIMGQEDFHGAVAACKKIQTLPGGGPTGHACLALANMMRKRASDTIPEVDQVPSGSIGWYEAKLMQGEALQQNGAFEAADKALREAMAGEPSRPDAHSRLALLLVLEGKPKDAIEIARKGRALDPVDPDVCYALGKILPPAPEAVDALTAATANRLTFTAAWVRLAEVEFALGHVAAAEKAAQQALKLDPKSANAHAVLAQSYVIEKKYDDALTEARAALKSLGNLGVAKLAEADAMAGKGDIDAAIEGYQTASGWMRDDPAPLVRAAAACLAGNRATTGTAFGEKATQNFPKWGPAWAVFGDALMRGRDRAAAKQAYQKALASEGPIDRAALEQKIKSIP